MQFHLFVVSCVCLMVLLAQTQASGMKDLLAKTGKDNVLKMKVEKKATKQDIMEQIARSLGSLGEKRTHLSEGHVGSRVVELDMMAELNREFAGQPNMNTRSIRKMKHELSAMRTKLDSSDSNMEIRNTSLLQKFNRIHQEELMRAGSNMESLTRNDRLRASTIYLPPIANDAITSLFQSCNTAERTLKDSKYYSVAFDHTDGSINEYTYYVPSSWTVSQNVQWSFKGWKDNFLDCAKLADTEKAVMFRWEGWCLLSARQYCPFKHQHTCQSVNEVPVYYSSLYNGDSVDCSATDKPITTPCPPNICGGTLDTISFRLEGNEVLI